jgi:hypothetical protein
MNDPSWTSGKYGGALQFDGINDYVRVSDSASLHYGEFTSCAWFKLSSFGDSYGGIVGRNRPHILRLSTNDIGSYVYNSDSIYSGRTFDVNLSLNEWYHVCLSFKRPVVSFYINGALFDTGAFDYDLMSSYSSLEIGNVWSHFLNGTIDEVALWNRSLSEQEISKIYGK